MMTVCWPLEHIDAEVHVVSALVALYMARHCDAAQLLPELVI